ncbi:MAG: hypothetical protein EZS28_027713 [Streblomastix strix]|uniref:Uncharacterized protein n=1 Tax=Streblomastix strix TaxID=222440 RepID=A0A5J4V2X6_9EUKA|nr:MAG: hypothetical protein EZS28_027713 [Streblomastix strix]
MTMVEMNQDMMMMRIQILRNSNEEIPSEGCLNLSLKCLNGAGFETGEIAIQTKKIITENVGSQGQYSGSKVTRSRNERKELCIKTNLPATDSLKKFFEALDIQPKKESASDFPCFSPKKLRKNLPYLRFDQNEEDNHQRRLHHGQVALKSVKTETYQFTQNTFEGVTMRRGKSQASEQCFAITTQSASISVNSMELLSDLPINYVTGDEN